MAQFFVCLTFSEYQPIFKIISFSEIKRKLAIKIPPRLNCVATLPCGMSVVLKATIENRWRMYCKHRWSLCRIIDKLDPLYVVMRHFYAYYDALYIK